MDLASLKSIIESRGRVRRDGRDWRGPCPVCSDNGERGHLAFREEDGKLLVKCWAGCKPEDIVAALGLTMKDLFTGNGHGKCRGKSQPARQEIRRPKTAYASIEAIAGAIAKRERGQYTGQWVYHRADGCEAFRVLRFDGCEATAHPKTYRPAYYDGRGYVEGDPPGHLPLYGLPELLVDTSRVVHVTEGEKACDAARSIGLLATTSAHGARSADKTDWTPLRGRDVVILPDNDLEGRQYAETVQEILLGLPTPATVRIVMLPDLPEKGDMVEFVESRDSVEPEALRAQIESLAERAQSVTKKPAPDCPKAVYVRLQDVQSKPVSWFWRYRIPFAMLTLLIGIEGLGKTFLALYMAANATLGRLWPDAQSQDDPPKPGNVAILTSEDHLEYTIRPRFDALGGNPARLFALKGVQHPEGDVALFDIVRHLPALESMIEDVGDVQLVIVDPLTAFLGDVDQHKNGEVRMALARFNMLAEKYGCAILGISHLTKDATKSAIHRTLGSVAFSAAARAVWLVAQDHDHESRRLFVPVKMNLGPMAKSLAFRIEDMNVKWEAGQFECSADEVLAVDGNSQDPKALSDACKWLREVLANGRVRSTEIKALATREQISGSTLKRAKAKLGVESVHEGIGAASFWYWQLSKEDQT